MKSPKISMHSRGVSIVALAAFFLLGVVAGITWTWNMRFAALQHESTIFEAKKAQFHHSLENNILLSKKVATLSSEILLKDEKYTRLEAELSMTNKRIKEKDESIQQKNKQISSCARASISLSKKAKAIPSSMSSFLQGVARIPKDKFLEAFDFGLPEVTDEIRENSQTEVLILYNTPKSIPPALLKKDATKLATNKNNANGDSAPDANTSVSSWAGPLLNVDDATSKCETLNVVSMGDPNSQGKYFAGVQCLALVGHEQMFHMPHFVQDDKEKHQFSLAQRQTVVRNEEFVGEYSFRSEYEKEHRDFLLKYFANIDTLSAKLKPILEEIAINNTVIVMVSNKSQSNMLVNFACACRAKGIKVENVVVFATDEETAELAQELHFTPFLDDIIFSRVNTKSHQEVLGLKVVSTHLVNLLGYDLLFNDIDMIWYKDPLERFHNPDQSLSNFDIYFADDGARWVKSFPYSVNTGFFYARHNERTRHLFRSWLFNLDILMLGHCDQQTISFILPEESSMTGLRIKVLKGEEYACGNRIFEKKHEAYINDLMMNKSNNTYILHVNWSDVTEKVGIMKQMGLWYSNENRKNVADSNDKEKSHDFMESCCMSRPIVSCHFPDKPKMTGACDDSEKQNH